MDSANTPSGGNKMKTFWSGLAAAKKKQYTVIAIGAVLAVVFFAGYVVNRGGTRRESPPSAAVTNQVVDFKSKLLERTDIKDKEAEITAKEQELKDKDSTIAGLNKQMEAIKSGNAPTPFGSSLASKKPQQATAGKKFNMPENARMNVPPLPQERAGISDPGNGFLTETQGPTGFPPVPPPAVRDASSSLRSGGSKRGDTGNAGGQDIEIGDITVNHRLESGSKEATGAKAKKKEQKIYLPPSYMEANLLSGLDAPTAIEGKAMAAPTLIRVAAPAVLPNEVKMQLKGCYVIAECTGNLASERADCRLVTLSCLTRDGRAVIDQEVKGFLVDQDGKLGLNGKVVAKWGATLARTALAGFFSGVGKAYAAASTPAIVTTAGVVTLPSTDSALKAGAGSGIAAAADSLQKFYLDLGRQTLPVIEVGASKRVTLVISKGLDLNVKLFCDRTNAFGAASCKEYDEENNQEETEK